MGVPFFTYPSRPFRPGHRPERRGCALHPWAPHRCFERTPTCGDLPSRRPWHRPVLKQTGGRECSLELVEIEYHRSVQSRPSRPELKACSRGCVLSPAEDVPSISRWFSWRKTPRLRRRRSSQHLRVGLAFGSMVPNPLRADSLPS